MEVLVEFLSLLEFRDIHYLMLESIMPEGQLVCIQFSSKKSKVNEKEKPEVEFYLKKGEDVKCR